MIKSFADKETEKVYNQFFSKKLPQTIQRIALRKLMMIGDTPTRVLANWRGFSRHGRTPQRAITSPLHPVTSLPLSRLFCGCLF